MEPGTIGGLKLDDMLFWAVTAAVAAGASFAVFMGCFYWFRREQRRLQTRIVNTIAASDRGSEELFVGGQNFPINGELVAQLKVNRGKQVISVLESDGKRFIHVDGELSPSARARMVRYLKSEGFMS